MSARAIRVAVLCDYPEEGWASMDLVAEMILDHLVREHSDSIAAHRICPSFRTRLGAWPVVGRRAAARNVDRILNRFGDYPRALRRIARQGEFDLYHVADHSYSQLLHALPPGRTVVTCHDLDTFACLLEPGRNPRPAWFRAMTRRILDGFRQAAAIACVSEATRDDLLGRKLVPAARIHVIPNGIPAEFSPDPDPPSDAEAARLLGPIDPRPDLLHVGTTIARKRIDILLDVFASVHRALPEGARLIKAGGTLTPDQAAQARHLGIADAIITLPSLSRPVLASVYRRAALVLQPSESEGFGFPVAEALACGAAVLASDLPALREVADSAADYQPVANVPSWTSAVLCLLDERQNRPDSWLSRRSARLVRARRFSWSAHADHLVALYKEIMSRCSRA